MGKNSKEKEDLEKESIQTVSKFPLFWFICLGALLLAVFVLVIYAQRGGVFGPEKRCCCKTAKGKRCKMRVSMYKGPDATDSRSRMTRPLADGHNKCGYHDRAYLVDNYGTDYGWG